MPMSGSRGESRDLRDLYATLGRVLRERFRGWRVGLITNDRSLAHASGLPLRKPGPPISHGGLRVQLYQTHPLP